MKTNTEEAIEFLNDCQDDYKELQEEGNNKGILEVIKLLEEGEKYKSMWKYFVKNTSGDMHRDFKRIEKGWKGVRKMSKADANDWKKHEKMMGRYFMEDVTIKIISETNENFTVEFIIDMEDFYLKSSFIAIKKRINNWLQRREV